MSVMKSSLRISLLFVFIFSSLISLGQVNCKVLKPELAGSYTGKCKQGLANGFGTAVGTDRYEGQFIKGLPDGKGTYTWATGESYAGEWEEGERSGAGDYTFFFNGKDSIISGNWLKNNYIGPISKKPLVTSRTSIDRYSIVKNGNFKNRVLVDIYQNGVRNTSITNFMISSSSGYDTSVGLSVGFDEVSFPMTIKITYTTMNKLKTASYYVEFECEIFEPGDWKIDLHN